MQQQARRILSVSFVIIGVLAFLLGLATLTLFVVLRPAGADWDPVWGSLVYLAIGVVSFFAGWRLKAVKERRGFEVVGDDSRVE